MSGVSKKLLQAGSGGGEATGSYIVLGHGGSPNVTLLDHTSPGSVSLAATYTLPEFPFGMAFSPDGSYIAAAHVTSPYFTLLDHTTPGSLSLATTYNLGSNGTSTSFSPDGNYVVVTQSSRTVVLLDHSTPGSLSLAAFYSLRPDSDNGEACDFSHSGDYIVTGEDEVSFQSFITLLDHTTPGSLSRAANYLIDGDGRNVSFSPDDDYIAVAHVRGPGFTLLDHTTPGSLSLATTYNFVSGGYTPQEVSFGPEGDYIAVAHNSTLFSLLDHTTPGSVSLAATYSPSATGISCDFSPDGQYIGVGANANSTFTLLDHTTPGSLSLADTYIVPPNQSIRAVAFSPN